MVDLFRLGDPADSWATDLATSQTVTPEQMLGNGRFFDSKRGVTVLVGDARSLSRCSLKRGLSMRGH